MPDPKKNYKNLYEAFGEDLVDVKGKALTEDQFVEKMANPDNRKAFFESFKDEIDGAETIEEFDAFLGFDKKIPDTKNSPFSIQNQGFDDTQVSVSNPVKGVSSNEALIRDTKIKAQERRDKGNTYQDGPYSSEYAKTIQAVKPNLEQSSKKVSEYSEFYGRDKKDIEKELQTAYRVLENDAKAKVGLRLSKTDRQAIENQVSDTVDYLGSLNNPDAYDVVDGNSRITQLVSNKDVTPAQAYERVRKQAFENEDQLQNAFERANDNLAKKIGLESGYDLADTYRELQAAEAQGQLNSEGQALKQQIESAEKELDLVLEFDQKVRDQKSANENSFALEGQIKDIRKKFQAIADNEQRVGKSDNLKKIVESTGASVVDGITAHMQAIQEWMVDKTGYMLPYGADAHLYNSMKNAGLDIKAEEFRLSRYKQDKLEQETALAKNTLPSDITKPLFETNAEVDGVNLVIDNKGKVSGVRDDEGFLKQSLSKKEVNAARKYEKDPSKFKTSESKDLGQRVKSAGYNVTKIVSDMIPTLAAAALSGGSSLATSLPMYSQMYGEAYKRMFEESGDVDKATSYAAILSAVTSIMEVKLGNLEQRFGKAFERGYTRYKNMDYLVRQTLDGKVTPREFSLRTAKETLTPVLKDVGSETFIEEIPQQIFNDALNATYNSEQEPSTLKDYAETILLTPVATLPMSVMTQVGSKNAFKENIRLAIDKLDAFKETSDFFVQSGQADKKESDHKINILTKIKAQVDEYVKLGATKKEVETIKDLLVDKSLEEERKKQAVTEAGKRRSDKVIEEIDKKLEAYNEIEEKQTTEDAPEDQASTNPEIQKLEEERDSKIAQISKPNLELSFIPDDSPNLNKETGSVVKVKSGNRMTERPHTFKDAQKAIQREHSLLQKLIDCL